MRFCGLTTGASRGALTEGRGCRRTLASRTWLLGLLAGCVSAVLQAGCASTASGPDIGRLPTITSADPQAEVELQQAREAHAKGRVQVAERRYRKFIADRPQDPLAAVAQLELGKLLLSREAYQEARPLFQAVAAHRQPAMAEQGRFYEAVAMAHMGEQEEAARTLRSMVGRTVAPSDTGLLLLTLADAEIALDNAEGAAVALNRLLESENVLTADRQRGEERLRWLLERHATPEQVERMLDAVPAGSPSYEPILRRAVADAQVAGDMDRLRDLIGYFEDAGIPLDEDLRALALQAADPQDANPQAVGAILSLSGRTRQVGEYALRGLMLAAKLPPTGPMQADAPKLVFRDDGGDANRAVQAVDELVNIHRVIAIIGPLAPQAARAAAQRAAELDVPLIALSPASGITDFGETVFQAFPSAAAEAKTLVAYARSQGKQRLALLYPENAYGLAFRDHVYTAVAELGGPEIVGEESYLDSETAFGKQVARLERTRMDALVLPDASDRIALVAPALAAAGLWSTLPGVEPPHGGRSLQLLAPSVAYSSTLIDKSGRYLQGAVFTTPYAPNDINEASRDFAQRYATEFGAEPNAISAVAHDTYALVLAATSAGALTREALAEQLPTQHAPNAVALTRGLGNEGGPTMPIRLMQLVDQEMHEAVVSGVYEQ